MALVPFLLFGLIHIVNPSVFMRFNMGKDGEGRKIFFHLLRGDAILLCLFPSPSYLWPRLCTVGFIFLRLRVEPKQDALEQREGTRPEW